MKKTKSKSVRALSEKPSKKPTYEELERRLAVVEKTRAISTVGYAGALLTAIAELVTAGKTKTTLEQILRDADARVTESIWRKQLKGMIDRAGI